MLVHYMKLFTISSCKRYFNLVAVCGRMGDDRNEAGNDDYANCLFKWSEKRGNIYFDEYLCRIGSVRARSKFDEKTLSICLHSSDIFFINGVQQQDFSVVYISALYDIFKTYVTTQKLVYVTIDEPLINSVALFKHDVRKALKDFQCKLSMKFTFVPILKGMYTYEIYLPDFQRN